jgi:hypothetical protein
MTCVDGVGITRRRTIAKTGVGESSKIGEKAGMKEREERMVGWG